MTTVDYDGPSRSRLSTNMPFSKYEGVFVGNRDTCVFESPVLGAYDRRNLYCHLTLTLQLDMTSNDEELPKKLQLYSFFMSNSAHSVRIALNLKGLDYEYKAVNLFRDEQYRPEFLKINPLGYVPALVDGDTMLADSFAIILYLEEKYPQHPLLPRELGKKALNYQAANIINSSIQPLIRLPILIYIRENLGPDERISWAHKHVGKGFAALEKLLKNHAGKYAIGDEIFLVDVFLEPIIVLSQRFNFDMSGFPLLSRLSQAYNQLPAFQAAMPENQPDFPTN